MGSDWGWGSTWICFGTLFFLIYINDLENGIISNVKFFADDTSLFSIVTNPTLSAFELNSDLKVIENWASQWKMSFNPDPNKQAVEMLFSRKRSEQNHPPLFFNNVLVAFASDHKQLGIILDCKLLLTKYISEKVAKARKGIGIICHLSFHVPLDVLDQLYKLFVRPLLDYCDIIYHVPAITNPFNSSISLKYSMQSIESTQYQAALAVSGAWKGSNTSKLYEELGCESLTDRRWYRRLLQFYKIINDLAPSYLKDIIPPLRRSLYGHPRHVFNEFRFVFRIVSNPGTILAVNLRRYHLSPNSKKLYWVSFVQLKNPYLLFTTLPVAKNCFNCEWVLPNWKVTEKITIFLMHPPICVSATLSLKIPNIFFCRCPLFSIPRLILVDSL